MKTCKECGKKRKPHSKGYCVRCYNRIYQRKYYKTHKEYWKEYYKRRKENDRT